MNKKMRVDDPHRTPEKVAFAQWLERAIIEADYDSNADFARKAGLKTGTLGNYLAATRRPDRRTCSAIASALGRTKDEVLARAGYISDQDVAAFHRTDSGPATGPLPATATANLQSLMDFLRANPNLLRQLAPDRPDKEGAIIRAMLESYGQRLTNVENALLRLVAKDAPPDAH